MAEIDQHLLELAQPGLESGEQPRASVRLNYNGTTKPDTFTIQTGLAALGGTPEEDPDPDKLVSFPVANQMAVLLTDRRVLVWSVGMRGKPKSYVGAANLSGIEAVSSTDGRLGDQITLTMKSGATVDVEVARGEDGEGFVAQLAALVTPTTF